MGLQHPGDSTPGSSEKLLQEVMGQVSTYVMILVKGEYMQSSKFFFFLQKVSGNHQEELSP